MEDSTINLVPIISYFVIVAAVYWGGKYSYYRKMRRIKKNSVLSSTND